MRRSRPLALGAAAALLVAGGAVAAVVSRGSGPDPADPRHAAAPTAPGTGGGLPTPASATGPSVRAVPASDGSLVATAVVPSVSAHRTPDGAVASRWSNPQRPGVPLTFRVLAERGGWLRVQLPQRPNGSTGWVRSSDVALTRVAYRLVVSTERKTLALLHDGRQVRTFSVATGTGGTPTPHGSFYLTELLAPTNPGYGPYAFGVSAYSEALTSFGGGPGQIGLHGTDDEGSIGHAASHGCIRMSNRDITALARLLPLGTPIVIR